jgi:hypothetical protein
VDLPFVVVDVGFTREDRLTCNLFLHHFHPVLHFIFFVGVNARYLFHIIALENGGAQKRFWRGCVMVIVVVI